MSEALLADLADDWQLHGAAVIERVRREEPVAYLKIVASLVRNTHEMTSSGGAQDLTDAELNAAMAHILAKINTVHVVPDHVERASHAPLRENECDDEAEKNGP